MCTQDELKIILAELTKVYREVYGDHLSQIILYGSYGRGDYQKDSDIDVAAIVDEPRKQVQDGLQAVWDKAHDLGLQYETLISPTAIPQDEYEMYIGASQYYRNIKTEGVLIEEREPRCHQKKTGRKCAGMGVDHTKIRTALYCAKGWILDREDSTPMISYHALLDENTDWVNTGVYGESEWDYWNVEMPPELRRLCMDAKEGQVDLIITPSITHFHKDSATALKIAGELADMPNPVEVFFQIENIFSLKDKKSIEVLTECLMMAP